MITTKNIGFLFGLLLIGGLGYYGFVLYPQTQKDKLNATFNEGLVKDLGKAVTLEDSLKVLQARKTMVEMPPYTEVSLELKNYLATAISELKERRKAIEAKKRQEAIAKKLEEERKRKAEEIAWETARQEDSEESYAYYQGKYPNGKYFKLATSKIENIQIAKKSTGANIQTLGHIIQTVSEADIIEEYIRLAGPLVIDCCSSYPSQIVSKYVEHTTLANGRFKITMTVEWVSTITNCFVKVAGELTVDKNGCNPTWLHKEKMAGGLTCPLKTGCRYICDTYFAQCLK